MNYLWWRCLENTWQTCCEAYSHRVSGHYCLRYLLCALRDACMLHGSSHSDCRPCETKTSLHHCCKMRIPIVVWMALVTMLIIAPPTAGLPWAVLLARVRELRLPVFDTTHATEDIDGSGELVV